MERIRFKYPEELDKAVDYGFEYFNPRQLTKKQIKDDIINVYEWQKEKFGIIAENIVYDAT